jgi:hypothetical protein
MNEKNGSKKIETLRYFNDQIGEEGIRQNIINFNNLQTLPQVCPRRN